jgi:hypothetical protein
LKLPLLRAWTRMRMKRKMKSKMVDPFLIKTSVY